MFVVLILIHEFGHFIVAKAVGIRVNEFAIGFGPSLFHFRKGDTEYRINLIPFGGYCAMEGEEEQSEDGRAFCNKAAWQRALVIVAGAVFNLILGLLIIAGTLIPQERFLTTTVGGFNEGAVSSQHGLQINDRIVEVDGRRIFSTVDLGYTFTGVKDGKVDMKVIRDGKEVALKDVKFETEQADGIDYIVIDFAVYGKQNKIGSLITQTLRTGVSYGRVVWFSLIDLITGKYGISAVSGPVGVTATIGQVASQNLANIWPIMALITINLGIFNLLPLPALDGGRLLFLIIEMIFRKKVPEKYESWVHTAGFVLLLMFLLIVTAKDIWALVV